jgi:exosortase
MFGRLRRAAVLLLLAIGVERVYHATLAGLATEWMSSPEASYGLILAGTALVVAVRRWPQFLAASSAEGLGLAALGLCAAGAALFAIGQLGADVFLTRISFVVLVAGAVWALSGWRAFRVMAAPLAFLLIAVPLPALIVNEITLPLQLAASRLAESMLSVTSIPVYRDGNLLMLPSATLEVAEACSGLRSAVSLGGVGVLLAWATQPTLPRRAALVAATLPIAVFMNGLRITATGVAVEAWGHPASGDWHTFMGWITFVLSVVALAAVQRLLDEIPESDRSPHTPLSERAYRNVLGWLGQGAAAGGHQRVAVARAKTEP